MAIKDELLSSAIDGVGTYLHSAVDIFLKNLSDKNSARASLDIAMELDEIAIPEIEEQSEPIIEKEWPIQTPLLFLNRKIVVCPECQNYDERKLSADMDNITCDIDCNECGCTFAVKCVDTSGDIPLLMINNHAVKCQKCSNENASLFEENGYYLTCSECGQYISVKTVLWPQGILSDV